MKNFPTIPGYTLKRVLGEGGMGIVFLATQESLGREVALKVIREDLLDNPLLLKRFAHEAEALRDIKHPFIVEMIDVSVDRKPGDKTPAYIAFKYIEGVRTLADVIASRSIPMSLRFELMLGIASAIAHIHALGLIHRDLKPNNILLTPENEPKLIDLGLVRVVSKEVFTGVVDLNAKNDDVKEVTRMTVSGAILGTLSYMAPEVCCGQDADKASDVYALGLILYEVAAGRPVFCPDAGEDWIKPHARGTKSPPTVDSYDPKLPPALVKLIDSCLHPEPASRPQSGVPVYKRVAQIIETKQIVKVAAGELRASQLPKTAPRPRDREVGEARVEPNRAPAPPRARAALIAVPLPTLLAVLALVVLSGTCDYLLLRSPGPTLTRAVPLVSVATTTPSARAAATGSEEAARLRDALQHAAADIDLAWLERFANQHKRIIKKAPETVSLAIKEHLTKVGILEPLEQFLPVARGYFGADSIPEGERWALRYLLCNLEIIEEFCAIHGVPLPWGDTSLTRVFPEYDGPVDLPSLNLKHARTWVRASNTKENKWFPGASFEEMWTIPARRPDERLLVWFAVARWKPGVLLDVRLDRRIRRIIRYSPPVSDPPPLKVHALEYELFGKIQKDVSITLTEALRFPRAYLGRWFPSYGISGTAHLKITIVDLPLRGLGADDPAIVDRVVTYVAPGETR